MASSQSQHESWNRWPHRLAVALVCATFPLICVGGLVTTYDAGMAVPDWPSTYGYNLFSYPLSTWWAGPWDLFIEHGHRLLGSLTGILAIAWLVSAVRGDSRRWLRGYAVACLALVIAQGALGGARVLMDEMVLARIHGCIGPLFLAVAVGGACVTSPWWRMPWGHGVTNASLHAATIEIPSQEPVARLGQLAWLVLFVAYLQIVLGAHLRHLGVDWSPAFVRMVLFAHLLGAAALVLLSWTVLAATLSTRRLPRPLRLSRFASAFALLVMTQVVLGAFTWRFKYQWPEWLRSFDLLQIDTVTAESMAQTSTVTAHVALGSAILATATAMAFRVERLRFVMQHDVLRIERVASDALGNHERARTSRLEVVV